LTVIDASRFLAAIIQGVFHASPNRLHFSVILIGSGWKWMIQSPDIPTQKQTVAPPSAVKVRSEQLLDQSTN
jgi:hypothetical protein